MAKKQLDDLGWDPSLDYDFDDPFAPVSKSQKRGVITRIASNFGKGMEDALTTPSSLRTMASKALPKGYGEAINFGYERYQEAEELHNIALKELEPSLPAMRRITQRHLPKAKRFLPKGVASKLQEFADTPTGGQMSQQQLDEQALQKSMAEVFGVQMEADARQNAENKVERAMQHAQSTHLSRQQLHSLNVMQQGMMRLVNYQDDITSKFQRRSLELQTRHYLVARDSLKLQVETARRVNAQLDAIVNNTAMPDIQKQDLRHTAKQTFRTRLLGAAQNSAGRFAASYFQNMAKRMQANVRGLAGGVDGMMDFADMGDGEGPPLLDMLARMAGQAAMTHGGAYLGKKAFDALGKKDPRLAQFGGLLDRGVSGMPYYLNRYARSATKRGGFVGLGEDFIKSVLGTHKLDTTVGRNSIGNMDKPATFDRLTRLSIVEVIPGLLARIEHNTARVLDPKAQRQIYNYDKRGFTDLKTAGDDMAKKIFNPSVRASLKSDVNDFINQVVGKNKISAKTRQQFFRQLLRDSGEGIPFDLNRYAAGGKDTPELTPDSVNELRNIFANGNVGKQSNGKVDHIAMAELEKKYASLDFGAKAPIQAAGVYRSAGYRELLDSQGLLERDGDLDKLKISKILDMIEGANYDDIKVKDTSLKDRFTDQISRFKRDKSSQISDLYVQGGSKAVLDAAKLKAGAYRDAATGEIIKKWEDIKGPIKDLTTNEIAVDLGQLTMGLVDSKGKTYSFTLRSAATGTYDWAANVASTVRATAVRKADEVKDVMNAKGEVLLQGWKIKAGKYRDALTERVIEKVEDIAGPVVDEDGNTVVTASDVANTLAERGGRKLIDAAARMRQRTESMLKQASTPLDPVFGTSNAVAANDFTGQVSPDYGDLVRLNTEQVELLKQIAQILVAQGPNGGSDQDPTYRRGFLDSLAIGGLKGAWGATKGVAKGAWWWTKGVVGGVGSTLGFGGRAVGALASGVSHRVGNAVRGIKDIYVKGKRSPVMTAQRIKLGHYQDVNTKKKITRWRDVTGPVIDLTTGETVLDQDDFNAGIYTKGPAGLTRLATKALMGFGSAVVSFYGGALSLPFRAAAFAVRGAASAMKWATNKQVDVYVKGETSPRLQATKMKTGRYYNAGPKKTGKVVRTYEDIYGEIKELPPGAIKASADDKTVLYEDEIHNPGICGRWGMKLTTPLSRMIGAVGGAAVGMVKGAAALFGGAMKGYGKLFGGLMGFGGGLLGAPFKFLGALLNPFEKHGAKQVEWLEKIHDVLDARLPGKKVRKGSWQQQFADKDAKAKAEQDEKSKDEKDRKWGVGGLLSFFKDKAKGLFGFGKHDDEEDEDEDEDDDGNTIIMGGDGDGKAGKGERGKVKGKKGGWRRNRAAKDLRKARKAGRALKTAEKEAGFLRRMAGKGKRFLNPKTALLALGTTAALQAMHVDKKSTAGKVVNGVSDAVDTASNISMAAQGASWLSGLFGGGGTAAAAGTVAAEGAAAAGASTAAGVGTAAAATTAAEVAGGTAAAVLGAPIWIPLAIGAAVVGAAGAAIYFAHKQYKYGKLTPVRRFRYLQYGVAPGDAGDNKKIFQLEELLLDHVGEKGGGLEIVGKSVSGGKDITMDAVYDLMDMKDGWFSDKRQQRQMFNVWYSQRFKPIFLTWVKALRQAEPKMALLDADEKLTGDKLSKVLKSAWGISRNIYAISQGPFEGESAVTDFGQIEDAYNLALKEAGKSEDDKKKDARKGMIRSAMNWLMPGGALAMNYLDNKRQEEEAKKEGAALSAKEIEKNAGPLASTTGGKITNTKGVDELLSTPLARLGKITPLAAIRYRAYGLTDLDLDRVRALAALEAVVNKSISVASSGTAYLTSDVEQLYYRVAGLFGLTAHSPKDRLRWCQWFTHRFFPVFRANLKAVRAINPSADSLQPERTLKATQLTNVAQQILNAKDDDDKSVWFWTISPWNPQERLNSDTNAISGSMLALKAAADKKLASETTVDGQQAALKKNRSVMQDMMDTMKYGGQKASDWLLGDKNNRNWLGRTVDGISNTASHLAQGASNTWNQAKNGNWRAAGSAAVDVLQTPGKAIAGALGFGPGLNHPGKGSGGDINALPSIPSNGEIANMAPTQRFAVLKPLFDAVAKMTGVDPNMLYSIASIESTFNPGASAGTSSAKGLFQFVGGTWADMLAKYGKVFGISPSASPFDPKANALLGAMYLKDNFNVLKKRLTRGVNETDLYMAHFMGSGGAAQFLTRDPNTPAAEAFPEAAKANPSIFYETTRQGGRSVTNKNAPRSIAAVYQLMQEKMAKAQSIYGGSQAVANYAKAAKAATTSQDKPATNNVAAAPTTTTTTANGPTGGVGATQATQAAPKAPSVGTQVSVQAGSSGTSSMSTGGGYAAMASGAGYASAAAAPSITSTSSLDAAAASQRADEAERSAAAERERQAREQRTRAAEAQSMRQSQTDLAQMSRVGEILQQSLETQKKIEKNTADAVTVLRQMLRTGGNAPATEEASTATPARPETRPASQRPVQRKQDKVPVSMRFSEPNG